MVFFFRRNLFFNLSINLNNIKAMKKIIVTVIFTILAVVSYAGNSKTSLNKEVKNSYERVWGTVGFKTEDIRLKKTHDASKLVVVGFGRGTEKVVFTSEGNGIYRAHGMKPVAIYPRSYRTHIDLTPNHRMEERKWK